MILSFLTDRVGENSADSDQTAPDQGLHYLQICLHSLDALLYGKATLFKCYGNYSKCREEHEYPRPAPFLKVYK